MNRSFYLASAFAALLLSACSSEEPCAELVNKSQSTNPFSVSVEEALSNADQIFKSISPATRGMVRSVRNIELVKSADKGNTRSEGEIKDLYYIVNYDNGFAILGADRRVNPVYAISDEGSFSLNDTIYNEGLAYVVRGINENAETMIENSQADGVAAIPPLKPIIPLAHVVEPLLPAFVQKWHQDSPYNDQYPFINGVKSPAGCANVAIGMILYHFKTPGSYNGFPYDWDNMSETNTDDVANLFFDLCDSKNLQINFANGVGAEPARIGPTLSNMGIYTKRGHRQFEPDQIIKYLKGDTETGESGHPVLLYYVQNNMVDYDDNGVAYKVAGHTWVIDGEITYLVLPPTMGMLDPDATMFHCVWGWGGKCNGYFYWDKAKYDSVDNQFSGKPDKPDEADQGYSVPVYRDKHVRYFGGFQRKLK